MQSNLLLGSALTLIAVAIGLVLGGLYFTNIAVGSVEIGGEYNPVQLTSADVGSSTVKSMAGTLGSLVVASSSDAGSIHLYRISSSTDPTATSSNTLLFSFPASVDEGTYTFDVGFAGGLLIDIEPTFNGNYVMTWR